MGLNLRGLMILSFLAASGITLVILGCALSHYNWYPIFVIIFYVLSPIPISISRNFASDSYSSDFTGGRGFELSLFLTSLIVVSAYALPVVLARSPLDAPTIQWGSAGFIFAGNTIIFTTIAVFMKLAMTEDNYGGW